MALEQAACRAAGSPSLEAFKAGLDGALGSLTWWFAAMAYLGYLTENHLLILGGDFGTC